MQEKKKEGRAPSFDEVKPGATIKRVYKGKEYAVGVRADGFHFNGKVYTSLSMIATALTGHPANGPKWFGLRAEVKATPKKATAKKATPKKATKLKEKKITGEPIGAVQPKGMRTTRAKVLDQAREINA